MTEFYKYGDSPKDRQAGYEIESVSAGATYKTYIPDHEALPPPEPISFEEALIDRLDHIIRLLQRPTVVNQTINPRHIAEEVQQRIATETARWSAYSKESAAVITQRQQEEARRGQDA